MKEEIQKRLMKKYHIVDEEGVETWHGKFNYIKTAKSICANLNKGYGGGYKVKVVDVTI